LLFPKLLLDAAVLVGHRLRREDAPCPALPPPLLQQLAALRGAARYAAQRAEPLTGGGQRGGGGCGCNAGAMRVASGAKARWGR